MKILILTNYANGLYLFRKELLQAFLEDGHEVLVSLPPDENVAKLKGIAYQGRGIKIIETALERRGMNPLKDFRLFTAYLKLLGQKKPDVVLTYTTKPNLYGGLACRMKKVPYLCNITGLGTAVENGGLLGAVLLRFYRISLKAAKTVFFQNEQNRDFMRKYGIAAHSSRMIPGSGVNLQEHPFVKYPSEKEHIRFLGVIRVIAEKGIGEYLEAAKIMKAKNSSLEFYLVGDCAEDERGQYAPLIKELEEQKIIRYLGHIDNVGEVMAESHIIVNPAYYEGLSNVLLEAASGGRPVLASRINGCVETFVEGKSGFSFEPRSTESLVGAMEKILALSGAEREQMGAEGRVWVEERFDRNIIIRAYRDELGKLKI